MFDLKLQAYFGSGEGTRSVTVPWKEALQFGVKYYEIHYQDANENGEVDVRQYFHENYTSGYYSNLRPMSILVGPAGANWMVMHWKDHAPDYQGAGYLFAYRKKRTDEWTPIDPGANEEGVTWEVDTLTGNLVGTNDYGERLFFPVGLNNWPGALINIGDRRCYLDGLLKGLLLPGDDDNPLTALLKSPQPAKGHAERLRKMLKRITGIR